MFDWIFGSGGQKRFVVVVLTVSIVVSLAAVPLQGTAASANVELDEAAQDQTRSRTLSFSFTASSNGSVSATDQITRASGGVVFEFRGWDGPGGGGSSTSWEVRQGRQYRVSYEASATSGVNSGTYSARAEVSGSGGSYSEPLRLDVSYASPRFGDVTGGSTELIFQGTNTASENIEVSIPNTGDGFMRPTSVEFSGVPSGIDVSESGLPSRISAGDTARMGVEIVAGEGVDAGDYSITGRVQDNLGNTESFQIDVVVRKPPVLETEGTVNLGNVLRGTTSDGSFTISEGNGYQGIDDLSVDFQSQASGGSLSLGSLRSVSTAPGGSDKVSVQVGLDNDVEQHATLQWTVRLRPVDEYGVGETVTFEARVIYPAILGDLEVPDTTIRFDTPRASVDTFTQTTSVRIPNQGDLDMSVTEVSASAAHEDMSATVIDQPGTVSGTSSAQAEIRIEAEPSVPEGEYPLEVNVRTDEAGSKTISRSVRVEHEVDMNVDRTDIQVGDVVITQRIAESIDIAERLGYEDVQELSIERVSGPSEYLTVAERPSSTLEAGGNTEFVVGIEFDASAELYETYTWEFRVSSNNAGTQTIRVQARPEPYSFERINEPLSEYEEADGWQAETAGSMSETLSTLEQRLRAGEDISGEDISVTIATGRSTLLLIESVEAARQERSQNGTNAAQDEIVRAVATYNLLETYASQISDDELRTSAMQTVRAAEAPVTDLAGQQTAEYRTRLEAGNLTTVERATTLRRLSRLSSLLGNTEQAVELQQQSDTVFEEYVSTVETSSRRHQTARNQRTALHRSATVSIAGQPLILNPTRLDPLQERSDAILAAYDDAADSYASAGATAEANQVRRERARTASTLRNTLYSLYISTAIYGLAMAVTLVRFGRNTYAYLTDAQAAVSGDFLV